MRLLWLVERPSQEARVVLLLLEVTMLVVEVVLVFGTPWTTVLRSS